jgi:glucose-1-phosphate cytidylyltransferase
MKAVILAGGRGTRIAEESHLRPKPMIEIGGRPILWHIMKIYAHHGVTDFVVCLGYKGYMIKEYFSNYFLHGSDVTIDLQRNIVSYHDIRTEPWKITLVETGESTQTGGRVKRVRRYLEGEEAFCLTYGDGLGNVDITGEIAFHRQHGKLATMTVAQPPARFGASVFEGERVVAFEEKPAAGSGYVNGGFFVLSPKVLDLIPGDETAWEREPLERLVAMEQLNAWRHDGFWQPMDTVREREILEGMWETGTADWKVWD